MAFCWLALWLKEVAVDAATGSNRLTQRIALKEESLRQITGS